MVPQFPDSGYRSKLNFRTKKMSGFWVSRSDIKPDWISEQSGYWVSGNQIIITLCFNIQTKNARIWSSPNRRINTFLASKFVSPKTWVSLYLKSRLWGIRSQICGLNNCFIVRPSVFSIYLRSNVSTGCKIMPSNQCVVTEFEPGTPHSWVFCQIHKTRALPPFPVNYYYFFRSN